MTVPELEKAVMAFVEGELQRFPPECRLGMKTVMCEVQTLCVFAGYTHHNTPHLPDVFRLLASALEVTTTLAKDVKL